MSHITRLLKMPLLRRSLLAVAWSMLGTTLFAGPLPEEINVRLGLGNHYKAGCWTPVEVSVRGGTLATQANVTLFAPDADDVLVGYPTRPDRPLQILPGQVSHTVLYARLGREVGEVKVQLQLANGRVIDTTVDVMSGPNGATTIPNGGNWVVTLGPSIGLLQAPDKVDALEVVALQSAAELPTSWLGYDGVDTLVISTSRPELFRELTDDSARLIELERWVELGGHLVLCAGATARETVGPGAPLARFAPGKLRDIETVRSGEALENYSGSQQRIPPPGRGDSIQLQAPTFDPPADAASVGVVEAVQGSIPLITRLPRGFGRVTFVACDLDSRTLANWPGRTNLVRKLVGEKPLVTDTENPGGNSSNTYGYSDLIAQLRGALEQFPGVRVVPFWIVALLILGYIALIGPGDYWLVKHFFKRMEWTWITFPSIVLVFSLGAYFAASLLKGSQLKFNQVDLVDLDTVTGRLRGGTWFNIFSPSTSNYDLSIEPRRSEADTDRDAQLSWLGAPGNNWRGMNTRTAGADLFGRQYLSAPLRSELFGVPIDVWSSKPFNGTWQAVNADSPLSQVRAGVDDSLLGEVTNPFDVSLTRCFVAYKRWAYAVGDLAPGGSFKIEPGQHRDDLQTLLKDFEQVRSNKFSSLVLQARPYDPSGIKVREILRTMMFHDAAGSTDYTHLEHGQADWTDLSKSLQLGRAVLVGEAVDQPPPVQLLRGDKPLVGDDDQHWTFYRAVLPVARSAAAVETKATGGAAATKEKSK